MDTKEHKLLICTILASLLKAYIRCSWGNILLCWIIEVCVGFLSAVVAKYLLKILKHIQGSRFNVQATPTAMSGNRSLADMPVCACVNADVKQSLFHVCHCWVVYVCAAANVHLCLCLCAVNVCVCVCVCVCARARHVLACMLQQKLVYTCK